MSTRAVERSFIETYVMTPWGSIWVFRNGMIEPLIPQDPADYDECGDSYWLTV